MKGTERCDTLFIFLVYLRSSTRAVHAAISIPYASQLHDKAKQDWKSSQSPCQTTIRSSTVKKPANGIRFDLPLRVLYKATLLHSHVCKSERSETQAKVHSGLNTMRRQKADL